MAQDELQLETKGRDISASVQMVETLLSLGICVNSKDDLGQIALHPAALRKHEGMMKQLLKIGADVECTDDDDRKP